MLAMRENWLQLSSASDTSASAAMHAGISAEIAAMQVEIRSIAEADNAAESPVIKIQELEEAIGSAKKRSEHVIKRKSRI